MKNKGGDCVQKTCLIFSFLLGMLFIKQSEGYCAEKINLAAMHENISFLEKKIQYLEQELQSVKNSQTSRFAVQEYNEDQTTNSVVSMAEHFSSIRYELEKMNQDIKTLKAYIVKIADHIHYDIELKKDDVSSSENLDSSGTTPQVINDNVIQLKYKSAYRAFKNQEFDEARLLFEKFIRDFPNHSLVGAAHYWLGEIYLGQKQYNKAASEYLRGYKANAQGNRAPNCLLKLATALHYSGKQQESCITLQKLGKEFPNMENEIKTASQKLALSSHCQKN